MLDAAEVEIGKTIGVPFNQAVVPTPDRPRCRPAMVLQEDGSAVIYLEIVIPPPHVHLIMTSVAGLQRHTTVLASDAAQVLYDFVLRTRGAYFEGRKQK